MLPVLPAHHPRAPLPFRNNLVIHPAARIKDLTEQYCISKAFPDRRKNRYAPWSPAKISFKCQSMLNISIYFLTSNITPKYLIIK